MYMKTRCTEQMVQMEDKLFSVLIHTVTSLSGYQLLKEGHSIQEFCIKANRRVGAIPT